MNQSGPRSPQEQIMGIILGLVQGRSLVAAAELGIADALATGPLQLEELAARTQANADNLFRLLRALETLGFFRQVTPGVFANTPSSEWLRRDVPGSQWAFAHLLAPGMGLWDGYSEMLGTIRTGKNALFQRWGCNLWDYLRRYPERGEIFNEGMRSMNDPMTHAITTAYDWAAFAVIADIGGGIGAQLVDILDAHPSCRGILFDQPEVLATSIPDSRIQRIAGSFFNEIPAESDAYLLRNIVHDWDDPDATRILRTVRKAMKVDARIMLIEWLIPDDSEFHFGKWADITMMAGLGGRERTRAEFERLFCESGFELETAIPATPTFTIIVGRPVD
jgi:hypothetical protein